MALVQKQPINQVETNQVVEARIDEAVTRIIELKQNWGLSIATLIQPDNPSRLSVALPTAKLRGSGSPLTGALKK